MDYLNYLETRRRTMLAMEIAIDRDFWNSFLDYLCDGDANAESRVFLVREGTDIETAMLIRVCVDGADTAA